MPQPHYRPPEQPPLHDLIDVRRRRYPDLSAGDFAKKLGITRLHLLSVERGRRRPSMDLVLRWLALLAPEARLSMFGDLPVIAKRMRMLRKIEKASQRTSKAA